jgi:predicted nucleic acid-binding OB-fold protein
MPEDSIETARERATRIWRNAWIQGRTEVQTQEEPQPDIEYERLLNQGRTKLIRAITKVISEQKHTFNLVYYKSAISRRKRRLLEEKLRRLEAEND